MDIYNILALTFSQDVEARNQAVGCLERGASSNYKELIESLATVLANKDAEITIRSAAGIYLKNMLVSRNSSVRNLLVKKWMELDPPFRKQVKDIAVCTLGTEKSKPSVCAQLISAIAYAEFPQKSWPELLPALTNNIHNNADQECKEASIEAIGYVCQDLPQGVLTPYSIDLLNNIVVCMKKEESPRVRLVATKALYNSLELVARNFEIENQRNLIMQFVCESALSTDRHIKIAGLQCLSRIVSLFYNYMESYMSQALFSITFEAMKSSDDDVALQGIEFWSSLSEEEQTINLLAESGQKQMFTNSNYSIKALPYIIPCVLNRLCSETDDDEDSWTPHKAATVCLMLMAGVCRNEIISHLLPFIGTNYRSPDPCRRDAAMVALGSLIDGVDDSHILKIATDGFPIIIELTYDQNTHARDSAFWALGKLYERYPDFSKETAMTMQSLAVAFESLKDTPKVATNACWAIYFMIRALHDTAILSSERRPKTYLISEKFESVLSAIYMTIKREDAGSTSLRAAAFELLNKVIECHPNDMHHLVVGNMGYILQEMNTLLASMTSAQFSQSKIIEYSQYQSMYCIALQNFIKILEPSEIQNVASHLMGHIINHLNVSQHANVREDVILTLGILAQYAPAQIIVENLSQFMPHLISDLNNLSEKTLSIAAASVLGDICTCCQETISVYVPSILQTLITNLSKPTLDKELQPPFMTLCGDISLAIGIEFRPYLSQTLEVIKVISSVSASTDDEVEFIDQVDEIKSSCLDTYTSIIQGMYQSHSVTGDDLFIWNPHISHIISLIEFISQDPNHSDSVTRCSCGLIGDLLHTFKLNIKSALSPQSIQKLVREATGSPNNNTKTVGMWLKNMLESF